MHDPTALDDLTAEHLAALKVLREAELAQVVAWRNRAEEAAEDKDYKTLAEVGPHLDVAGRALRRTVLLEQRLIRGQGERAKAQKAEATARRAAVQARKDTLTYAMVDAIDRPGCGPERIDSLYAELDRWIDSRADDDGFLGAAVNDLIDEAGAALGLQLEWELAPDTHPRAGRGDFAPAETLNRPRRLTLPTAPRARRAAAKARAVNSS